MFHNPFSDASREVRRFHKRVKELQRRREAVLVQNGFPPWYARLLAQDDVWFRLFTVCSLSLLLVVSLVALLSHAMASPGWRMAWTLALVCMASLVFVPYLFRRRWLSAHPQSPYAYDSAFFEGIWEFENPYAFRLAALEELRGRLTADEIAELKRLCPEPGRHGCYPTYYRELDWDVATRRFEARLGELLTRPAAI